ncbi:hypothetical protein CB0940_08988 [Cercospora beticola]|uniref:Uncharacterized protein n=1 Tax=Cercospora beticola TaxID=122368 RepID=A0A2G5HQ08_CERBT|nr:hypothetical protein CB0940_08988 [Cercospora beticola]PIA94608.1 hypothetical protein CB0940_08988 [Cercospora beticola]
MRYRIEKYCASTPPTYTPPPAIAPTRATVLTGPRCVWIWGEALPCGVTHLNELPRLHASRLQAPRLRPQRRQRLQLQLRPRPQVPQLLRLLQPLDPHAQSAQATDLLIPC